MIQRLVYKISPERHRKLPHFAKMLLNPWMKKLGDPPTDPKGVVMESTQTPETEAPPEPEAPEPEPQPGDEPQPDDDEGDGSA